MDTRPSGSTNKQDSGSPSQVSSTSTDGKLPSVQQILPSLLGIHNWTLGSMMQHSAGAHNPNHNASRNAATQFLLANQALQGLQAQQIFQMPSSNGAAPQLVSMPVGTSGQASMLLNSSQISALASLHTKSSSHNPQNSGMALVNQLQMQQLLNNGLSSTQILSALNNQLLANAVAQSNLQLAVCQQQNNNVANNCQSAIRRVGKVSSLVDSSSKSSVNVSVKQEDDDGDSDGSGARSENEAEAADREAADHEDDRSSDRGPTIAQLTHPSVIKSTKAVNYAQAIKSSYVSSTRKSASSPTSSSSPVNAPSSSADGRHNKHEKSVICSARSAAVVDGIDLEEIREFAKRFKIRRLSLGLTQTQVGQALSATEGPSYSQSAICRFEKLDITPRSAQKIKPVLEKWMREAEERYENGGQNLAEFVGCEPNKKRKRRTSFTPQALEVLNAHFEKNTHPSGAEVTSLADELAYDREVVRVWFCNRR
ncbi:hypothetical protein RvY_12902-2 [Ramazzottius varieornatus]|nr:hypothetical protein RvY_12902-2 [Ramazzottius varieornatus]